MKKFSKIAAASAALGTTGMALAQDTTNSLTDIFNNLLSGNIAGLGVAGVVVVGLIIWLVWRFFVKG